ncbi:MAG: IMPACT family protein [Christensenellales bacterium]|nr:YigZ family protein [Clostridium sp.]MDY5001561.1 YigZ family protein [Eubacteriales bacterium]MCI6818116.1 YigZ family protein [Clostridium sp.]MCI6987035.1 YigZ family protein [Clostridium sp.]MCI7013399.1 YigZ family protein [Clostridium sp.]
MALKPYKTARAASETEFTVNKSRFIGRCFPVSSEEEALARLDEIRKLHHDATHNCWAYNLRGGIMRFSDDGEPGGTAGMPIMDTLIRSETLDAIIIVTRYFGGILLGSGGLVRAYSKSASDALSSAGVLQMLPCSEIEFFVDYSRYGGIEGFVRSNSTVKNTEFLDNIRFNCLVPFDDAEGFIAEIIERTDGRSSPKIISEEYLAK